MCKVVNTNNSLRNASSRLCLGQLQRPQTDVLLLDTRRCSLRSGVGHADRRSCRPQDRYHDGEWDRSLVLAFILTLVKDVGNSINPALDYGQIEGAFIQGQGLFTLEESLWNSKTGALFTTGPGTYKIPGFGDIPQEFNVGMLKHDSEGKPISWKHLRSIASSKGVGEPPLFMGSTVFFALREAVRAARQANGLGNEPLVLDSPATAEALRCIVGDELGTRCVVLAEGKKPFFERAS